MSITRISELLDCRDEVLLLAHRGQHFGLIPENTLMAYDLALRLGADLLETDIQTTLDGHLVICHDREPCELMDVKGFISGKTLADLQAVRLKTRYGMLPPAPLLRLEDVLEHYRGKALINIDKTDTVEDLERAYQVVTRMNMLDHVLFKSPACVLDVVAWLDCHAEFIAYMPIIRNDEEEMRRVLTAGRQHRFPAVEITFRHETNAIFSPETLRAAARLGMLPMVNAISLSEEQCGGHGDLPSLLSSMDAGWGWLIDRGARILQTDRITELKHYVTSRKVERI